MAKYRTSVISPWTPQKAFDYMSDLRNFAEWDPGVTKAELIEGEAGGPDAAYELKASGATLVYRVTTHAAPTSFSVRAKNALVESIDDITVEIRPGGCTVTYAAELRLPGVLKLTDPALQVAFNRIGDKAAKGLVHALDGEPAP